MILEDQLDDADDEETESCSEDDLRRFVQKERDLNRIINNQTRKQDRRLNSIEELLAHIEDDLKASGKHLKGFKKFSGKKRANEAAMVVHLSDLHLQSVIDTPTNRFDFLIASKRLQLLASRIKDYGKLYGVKKLVVAMGGDFLKNDKRTDEYLTNACNRSKAVVLSTHLLRQMLMDLRQSFYVEVVSVAGNESRAKDEIAWASEAVTDNYDSLIYWMLEMCLQGDKGLTFHPHQGNEQVFSVHDQTFLLLHGHQLNIAQQKSIQSVIGKYSTQGINVTHVIGGHIHSANISDYSSRSASLCGGDAYAYSALGYASKASQKLHIPLPGHMDSVRVDPHDASQIPGYDCLTEVERLGAKSLDRSNEPGVINPIRI